ncbi:MAG: multicopper oxidase domain-containing protein [Xanthobacteraceae bacterium]|nr:multicopper oxidase domain-containing protein [Xanthobacteraceae bacterium]
MKKQRFWLNRRAVLTSLGGLALEVVLPRSTWAQSAAEGAGLNLTLKSAPLALQQGSSTPVWALKADAAGFVSRARRGDTLNLALTNDLPVPAAFEIRGIDGAARLEPLLAQPPLGANGKTSFMLPLRQAGTFLIDPRLLGDGAEKPILPRVLIVEDNDGGTDRDEVLLIDDWRLRSDGSALAPGVDAGNSTPLFTINRVTSFDIKLKRNERVKLRIVNGCQRAIVALKITDHDPVVMAIDGEAAEPFVARQSQIILAPGTRVDAFLDATQPSGTSSEILLHDGTKAIPVGRIVTSGEARSAPLPAPKPLTPSASPRVDLKGAQRFDLSLDPSQWSTPASFDKNSKSVLRAKRGQTVVLAITNTATTPATFHLHGHHFRLLDRMDDGWKPFWLDTLVFQPGQTQRIAFAADFTGNFLMETMGNAWSAPHLVRWYAVE